MDEEKRPRSREERGRRPGCIAESGADGGVEGRQGLAVLTRAVVASVRDAAGVLLPVDCGGCGREGPPLCATCAAAVERPIGHPHPVEDARLSFPVVAAHTYDGPVARCLRVYKDEGRIDLARALALPLRSAVVVAWGAALQSDRPPPELVAIPSAPSARRRRGYSPVAALVRAAGLEPSATVRLHVVRRVSDQAALGVAARRTNLAGALRASGAEGRRILLVDDVVTTGATLLEAARAVESAGGSIAAAACLAHAEKRSVTTRGTISDNPVAPG